LTIIAHRGAPDGNAPENSLEAFLLAKKHGADGIEFDVSQTKDKQNIILHGDSLAATTFTSSTCKSFTQTVDHYTLQELKDKCPLKNGEKIMTLEEFLPQVKGLFDYYFLDIKILNPQDAAQAEQETLSIINTVQRLGMDDKIIFSSYDKTATYIL
jgi:glycerophosphoryl diester phosphodiesterase